MKSVRAHWDQASTATTPAPRLRSVPRTPPLDEPDTGPGRLRVRIVRSRRGRLSDDVAEEGQIVRLEPDDRVILPYDFR